MSIVQTINSKYQFEQAMKAAGRGSQFSYEGFAVLFDYLDDLGEDVEFDAVAICCDYNEMNNEELIDNYNIDVSEAEGDEEGIKGIIREYLEEHTIVVGETEDSFVYVAF